MENIKDFLQKIAEGKGNYKKNKITSETKVLNHLKDLSKNNDFEIELTQEWLSNKDNFKKVTDMIDEWEFKAKSVYDVNALSLFKIYPDGSGVCQLCGHSGCKTLYGINDKFNGKQLFSGSQCIKKFGLRSYIGEEEASVDEVTEYLKGIEDEIDDIIDSPYAKIFNMCHRNNLTILNNASDKNILKFYLDNIDAYGKTIFTAIQQMEKYGSVSDDVKNEAKIAFNRFYSWSNSNNNNDLITFIPELDVIVNNTMKYSAKFKIILSYMIAEYYRNGKTNKNLYNTLKMIYNETKDIETVNEWSLSGIGSFTKDRFERAGKIKPYDMYAMLLSLPKNLTKAEYVIKNGFRTSEEKINSKFCYKEHIFPFAEKLYTSKNKYEDDSDFGVYIDTVYTACNNVIPAHIEEREKYKTRNKPSKDYSKKVKKHKDNYI